MTYKLRNGIFLWTMGSPGFKEKKNQTLWFLRAVQCLLLNRCSLVKMATLSIVEITYLRTLAVQHQAETWKPAPILVPGSPLAWILGAVRVLYTVFVLPWSLLPHYFPKDCVPRHRNLGPSWDGKENPWVARVRGGISYAGLFLCSIKVVNPIVGRLVC